MGTTRIRRHLVMLSAAIFSSTAALAIPAFAAPGNGNGQGAESRENGNGSDYGKAGWKNDDSDLSAQSSSDDGAPGQTTPKGGDSDLAGGGAGNSENSTKDRPSDASNGPGTGQEPAPGCTNPHQGADPNQGGANQNPGPYDNTCNGRPSENGNGGGNANGRPCMGCVGNADDKNPPGQKRPDGRDGNAGYECDRNNGIGKGNPAHTDCQPPSKCVDNPNTSQDECNPPPPCVDQQPNVQGRQCEDKNEEKPPCVDMQPDVEGRQCGPGDDEDDVLGDILFNNPDEDDVLNRRETDADVDSGLLPFTGGNMLTPVFLGLYLIVLGGVTLKVRRKKA